MKTKEEMKKWFFEKLDNCYLVEHQSHKGDYYMFYDEQFIRQKKLRRILKKKSNLVYPDKPTGICLFEQDWKNNRLWCDHDKIWSYFETNYSPNYNKIKELIICMLEEHDKLNVLTPLPVNRLLLFSWKNMTN